MSKAILPPGNRDSDGIGDADYLLIVRTGGELNTCSAAKVEGVPCSKLEVSFEGKNLKGTGKGAAEGMTLEKGSIQGTVTVLLPIDNKTGHLKESGAVTIESHLVGKNDDGKQVTADTKTEEMVEKTFGRGVGK